MFQYTDETKETIKRLSKGATLGMVDSALKHRGIGSGPRAEILESARRTFNRRARMKHLLRGVLGLTITCAGGFFAGNVCSIATTEFVSPRLRQALACSLRRMEHIVRLETLFEYCAVES